MADWLFPQKKVPTARNWPDQLTDQQFSTSHRFGRESIKYLVEILKRGRREETTRCHQPSSSRSVVFFTGRCGQNFEQNKRFLRRAFCRQIKTFSSRIRVSKHIFEQKKRFLRALPTGRISHFTSRIYPSLFTGAAICATFFLRSRRSKTR